MAAGITTKIFMGDGTRMQTKRDRTWLQNKVDNFKIS